jgi:dTDP-4-dehydrorhamnose reductase
VAPTQGTCRRRVDRVVRRWLVVGANGMLGHDMQAALSQRDVPFTALGRQQLDITDAEACLAAVAGHDVVVNAAGWTAVDDAESAEPSAFAVNALGAANLARACANLDARLVQISTDYVFDGKATTPYREDAQLAPLSAYGRTKAAGEWSVRALLPRRSWVVRTAWLYGEHGSNFVKTMRRLERAQDAVDVVDDQTGQPTWTVDLADQILAMVEAEAVPGIYHGTSSGQTTWCGLARAVFELCGADPTRVRAATTAHHRQAAPRPTYSVLRHDAWVAASLPPMRPWRASLEAAMGRLAHSMG